MDPIWAIFLLAIYVVPTLIALLRRTQLIVLVCVVNVFLGWAPSLALAMLLPGDGSRHGAAAATPEPSPATPIPTAVGGSGPPRELDFLFSPTRAAGLSLLAPVVYPLWWFWGFFEFARQEKFPRTESFWWIFVPFYGWAIIGRLFHDLEARLGAKSPAHFNAQVAVALVVAGIVSSAQAFRLPVPISVISFAMGMALVAVGIYRVQEAVNALLRARYPGGTGAGMVPAELIAATAGFLLVGTLVLDAAPSVSRFSASVSSALASAPAQGNFVYQPTAVPTVATVPTVGPTPAPIFPTGPFEGTGTLSLTSEPGDYVGQGKAMTIAGAPWRFMVTRYYGPDSIAISVDSSDSHWRVDLQAPKGQVLQQGTYTNAERFNGPSIPGIAVTGAARACNQDYGSFTITTMELDANGQVKAFEATFEQHCETRTAPALRGSVRFDATATR